MNIKIMEMLLYGLVLFAVFGSFLGGWGLIGQYWPLLLILLGLIVLGQNFFRQGRGVAN